MTEETTIDLLLEDLAIRMAREADVPKPRNDPRGEEIVRGPGNFIEWRGGPQRAFVERDDPPEKN